MGNHIFHTDINSFNLDPKTSNRRLLSGYLIRLRKKPNIHCLILLHCYIPTQTNPKSITILLNYHQNTSISKNTNTKSKKNQENQMGILEISRNYQVQRPIWKGSDCFGQLVDNASNVHRANLATVFVSPISLCLSLYIILVSI